MTAETKLPGNLQNNDSLNNVANEELLAEEQIFQWTKQWYPMAVVEYLDPSRPHKMQLLGNDVVLWRDGSGQWRCFEDVCPHRLVPLSEGRVEADGTLLCAYHAWRFDSEGNCVSIPQSKDEQTAAKNCQNPKSCAVVYPTQERQGLLWVWAETGDVAKVESQLQTPRIVAELEDNSGRVVKSAWNFRDLPYGWDFFMENVSDPAHVPVSHHGIIGDRYKDAKYYDMIPVRHISTQDGFAFEIQPTQGDTVQAIHDFQPPCYMKIAATSKDGGQLILVLYATPTRPGWCRHIGCQVFIKNPQGKKPQGLSFFGLPLPIWLTHVLASLFLHQDMVFLHYQEAIIAQRRKGKWLDAVYTPNPQDKMVIALRRWLENRAGGGIPWAEAIPQSEQDKQKLFDVWTTHTQNCTVCQNALKNINRLTLLAYVAAAVCLFIAVIIDARTVAVQAALGKSLFTLPPIGFWLALSGSLLLAVVGYQLKRLTNLFYFYKFEHACND
jgi:phenylpropionate dioxygenase-like ring-hydroxylating dioxygenase large terminal subunit